MNPIRFRFAALAVLLGAAGFSCSTARPAPDPRTDSSVGSVASPAERAAATPSEAPRAKTVASSAPAEAPAASGEGRFAAAEAKAAADSGPSAHPLTQSEARAAREADEKAFESPLELVESEPVETSLEHADVRDAKEVWPAMFNRASDHIDVEEFYLSDLPGSALEPSVRALEAAAARGVKLRLIADAKMARTYPEALRKLAGEANVQVREINFGKLAGGVQHAKFFVVDGAEAYEGSQNFDWRSLSQIQEMGLRFRAPEAVRALEDVFETDWALAGGAEKDFRARPKSAYRFPTSAGSKDEATLTFVASPQGWLPDEARWDLPALVALIDGAKRSVDVQVLTYRAHGKRDEFPELEDALKRAAARGVRVTLLVSNWSLRKGMVEPLQALAAWRPSAEAGAAARPIAVSVLTIPPLASGYLPFARVAHAKYLVVDGARAWVGTNNWERDYFTRTRNVGLVVEGGAVPPRLEKIFTQNLQSAYAAPLDPSRSYPPPRTGL